MAIIDIEDREVVQELNDDGTTTTTTTATTAPNKINNGVATTTTTSGHSTEIIPTTDNQDYYKTNNPYDKPLTDEEKKQAEKKHKRNMLIKSIGDGLTAMSNLFFTTKEAPNVDVGIPASERARANYDKLLKERKENDTAYYNGLERARLLDKQDGLTERSWRHRLSQEEDLRSEREKEREEQRKNRAEDKAERQARQAKEDEKWQKIFDKDEKQHKDRMGVAWNNKNSGSGKPQEVYSWYDADGNIHYTTNKNEWYQNSKRAGTWVEDDTEEVTTTTDDMGSKTTRKTKKAKGYSRNPKSEDNYSNTRDFFSKK